MENSVSNEQLEELLDYLAEHTTLAKGVGLGSSSKVTIDRQWNNLAMKLNSFGSGSSQTGDRWKKFWADLKHETKTRLAKRRQDVLGTGGGPSTQEDLSETDKKVLAIIGDQAVYGDSQHRVPVFNIQPEVPVLPPGSPDDIIVSEEVVITEWVMDLERNRVKAKNKLAEAYMKMAEAAKMSAEASYQVAETSRIIAETSRQQVEVIKSFSDVVAQLSSASAARDSQ